MNTTMKIMHFIIPEKLIMDEHIIQHICALKYVILINRVCIHPRHTALIYPAEIYSSDFCQKLVQMFCAKNRR